MKLIHRLDLEVINGQRPDCTTGLNVKASFYRPFLDGSYKVMIIHMMDTGCFDDFMKSVLEQLLLAGMYSVELVYLTILVLNYFSCPIVAFLISFIMFLG